MKTKMHHEDEVLALSELGKGRRRTLSRRAMLRGAGGLAIALPMLEIMWDDKEVRAAGEPLRYGIFFVGQSLGGDNDPVHNLYVPTTTGLGYAATQALQPLFDAGVNDSVTVVSNLEIPYAPNSNQSAAPAAGRISDFHISSLSPLFSGMRSDTNFNVRGVTSDQLVADTIGTTTVFKNLVYQVPAAWYLTNSAPYGRDIMSVKQDMSGLLEVPGTISPRQAFDTLFYNFAPPDDAVIAAQLDFAWRQRKSVVDVVRSRAEALLGRLGGYDKLVIERHLAELRDLERRINTIPPAPGGNCQLPTDPGMDPPIGGDLTGAGDTNNGYSDEDTRAQVFMDMIHMAYTCDLTRVVALLMSMAQSHMNAYQITGIGLDIHELGHSNSGMGTTNQVTAGIQWHMKHFGYLVNKLKTTTEGTGTVLDNCALVLIHEGGHGYDALDDKINSAHSTENMACLIAGGAGNLKMGHHIVAPSSQRHPGNVILTAMNAVGLTTNTFGEVTSGPIAALIT